MWLCSLSGEDGEGEGVVRGSFRYRHKAVMTGEGKREREREGVCRERKGGRDG